MAPQRGLGVAQLEKKKKAPQRGLGVALLLSDLLSRNPLFLSSSPALAPLPQQPSSSPHDLLPPSPNPLFRPKIPPPNADSLSSNPLRLPKSSHAEMGWSHFPVQTGHVWNQGEFGGHQRRNYGGFAYRMQRAKQFQQQSSSSVMVNNSSGILSSSSSTSVLNFRMEHPSNQILCSFSFEEKKMVVGRKRSYPFQVETPTAPEFQYKYNRPGGVLAAPESEKSTSRSNISGEEQSNSTRPPFFNFFPAAKEEEEEETARDANSSYNCDDEVREEVVDLRLKL